MMVVAAAAVLTDYDEQRQLVGTGHKLILVNITRDSEDVFQCQSDNGVPPTARKTFHVTVECKHLSHLSTSYFNLSLFVVLYISFIN